MFDESLKICDCLLDENNGFLLDDSGRTVGRTIHDLGRQRYWGPRERKRIDTVVIHYMSAAYVDPSKKYRLALNLDVLLTCGVSCHYIINRSGGIYRLVPEGMKAWHCGPSIMPDPDNRTDVNQFSIGIELLGMKGNSFTTSQYSALYRLCLDIERRYRREMIYVGHDQIAGMRAVKMGLRKEPKTDPGDTFRWDFFAALMTVARNPEPEEPAITEAVATVDNASAVENNAVDNAEAVENNAVDNYAAVENNAVDNAAAVENNAVDNYAAVENNPVDNAAADTDVNINLGITVGQENLPASPSPVYC